MCLHITYIIFDFFFFYRPCKTKIIHTIINDRISYYSKFVALNKLQLNMTNPTTENNVFIALM